MSSTPVWRTQIALAAESSWSSLWHAVRALVRFPAVSLVAVLMLAIGIGANAATFSVVYSVLLQPLPYSNREEIVFLARVSDRAPGPDRWISLGRVEALREATSFAGVSAYLANRVEDVTLSGSGDPEVLRGTRISANVLDVLGAAACLARAAHRSDPGAANLTLATLSLPLP